MEEEEEGVGRSEWGLKKKGGKKRKRWKEEEWSQKRVELEEEEGIGRGRWSQNGAWKKRMVVGRGGKAWKVMGSEQAGF